MGTNARANLRSALRQLEADAQATRKAAGKPCSRREAAKQAGLPGQRISDWLNGDDPAKAPPAPQDWDRVWDLIRIWCDWAGHVPEKGYWDRMWQAATLEAPTGAPAPQQVDATQPRATRNETRGGSVTDEQARAVEYLARETRRYWQGQAKERRIISPSPAAVRWQWAGHDVAVLPGEVGSQVLTAGVVAQLREELYEPLEKPLKQPRVVILGGPGAGKTSAMLWLLVDILNHRPAGSAQPVPVWLTLGGWNPQTTSLQEWAVTILTRDYSGLAAASHGGPGTAGELIRAGRIALFIDGLDELLPALQGQALQRIDRDGLGLHIVLTSRPDEYRAALEQGRFRLWDAAVIEILPVDVEHAESFLLAQQLEPQRGAWQNVIDHMRAHPDSVPARTLTSPLALSLARETYTNDPAGLMDTQAHPTSEALLQHLLTRSLDLAYHDAAERQHAIRWLAWIAHHMGTSRDLRWWDIPDWLPQRQRQLVGLLAGTLNTEPRALTVRWPNAKELRNLFEGGVMTGVAAMALTLGGGKISVGLAVGSVFVPVGLGAGLIQLWSRPPANAQAATPVEIYRSDRRRTVVVGIALGLVVGIAFGLFAGLRAGRAFGIAPGLVAGLAVGLLFGLVVGLGSGLGTGRVIGLVVGLVVGLRSGPALGATSGLTVWLLGGLGAWFVGWSAAAQRLIVAQVTWGLRGRQVRFLPLLQTALERQVLRQAGSVYQFRHAALQDLLAQLPLAERTAPPSSRSARIPGKRSYRDTQ